jgi:two-component system, sensor histidine kinase and response regulator
MSDLPVLDPASINELVTAGGPEFLAEILDMLLESGDAGLREMKQLLAVRDSAGTGKAAHTLKGAAAGVGAVELAAACARIESAGRNGDGEALPALVADASACFERVRRAIADLKP